VETHPQPSGLTSAQVAERVAAGETNDTGRRTSRPVSDIIRANVLTRFNAIVGALAAVVLVTGHPQDALFGLVIVANTGIGVIQELRAKRTLDQLSVLNVPTARVVRDAVLELRSGDQVVVDGQVLQSSGLEIDESLLSGEADPIGKGPGDEAMSGSFVVAGSGRVVATKVGGESYAAKLTSRRAGTLRLGLPQCFGCPWRSPQPGSRCCWPCGQPRRGLAGSGRQAETLSGRQAETLGRRQAETLSCRQAETQPGSSRERRGPRRRDLTAAIERLAGQLIEHVRHRPGGAPRVLAGTAGRSRCDGH
jgi:hypothetical protein